VMLCTADTQQTMKVAEATEGSISDAWWKGPRMVQIRSQVQREDFSGLNLCRGCNQPYSPNMVKLTAEELDDWKQSEG